MHGAVSYGGAFRQRVFPRMSPAVVFSGQGVLVRITQVYGRGGKELLPPADILIKTVR